MSNRLDSGSMLGISRPNSTGSAEQQEEYLAMLFDVCRTEDGKASVGRFLEEIQKTGIRKTDPRLESMMKMLHNLKPTSLPAVEDLKLDTHSFRSVLSENVVLISKAFQNQMIIPAFEAFCDNLTKIYEECKQNKSGRAASYIPHLASYSAENWGVSICTVDGQRFSLGHATTPFTLQATSTPLTYAITLNELGEKLVHKYQGKQPSGRMYNEIVLDHNNKPHNPLVSSGAIMSSALILNLVRPEVKDMSTKFEITTDYIKDMAGGEHLTFNNSVFLAERAVSDRNYALAFFMRENKCLPEGVDIKKALDFHFQMCSLEMTCESNSVVAATIANGGVCPITGKLVIGPESIQHVRSLMYSCGMYNYSGQFAFWVGLPGKSGSSGALMVIVPNVMGITMWSPLLDSLGNPVRGIQFCKELVKLYRFHRFDGIGRDRLTLQTKVDPVFQKYDSASKIVIQILLASKEGDLRTIKRFWLQDIDLNVSDYDGRTALHLSSAEGHLDCIKFLIEVCGVDPDPQDRWGRTPFAEAVLFGKGAVAAYLKDFMDNIPCTSEQWSEVFDSDEDQEVDDEEPYQEIVNDLWVRVEDVDERNARNDGRIFSNVRKIAEGPSPATMHDEILGTSSPSSYIKKEYLDPNAPDLIGPNRRRSMSSLSAVRRHMRVNTRSPRRSPGGSPPLPRAQFSCLNLTH